MEEKVSDFIMGSTKDSMHKLKRLVGLSRAPNQLEKKFRIGILTCNLLYQLSLGFRISENDLPRELYSDYNSFIADGDMISVIKKEARQSLEDPDLEDEKEWVINEFCTESARIIDRAIIKYYRIYEGLSNLNQGSTKR